MKFYIVSFLLLSGCVFVHTADLAKDKLLLAAMLKSTEYTNTDRGNYITSLLSDEKNARIKKRTRELYEYENLKAISGANHHEISIHPALKDIIFKKGLVQQLACKAGEKPSIEQLQKFMALSEKSRFTAQDLYYAIYNENFDAAKAILTVNPELLNQKISKQGKTALALTATLHKKESPEYITDFASYLLNAGAEYSDSADVQLVPEIKSLIVQHDTQKKKGLAELAQHKEDYRKYQAFKKRSIILPAPYKKLMQPQEIQELEQKIAGYNAGDHKPLPLPQVIEQCNTYTAVAKNYPDCLANDAKCPVCWDYDSYKQRVPVLLCTGKHTMCSSCFNDPNIQSCPLCREKFSERSEFWKPYQLNFCQSCSVQKKDLGFTYCAACNHVGAVCFDCKNLPCCKQSQKSLDIGALRAISKHKHQYLKHEQETKKVDLNKLDKAFQEQQLAIYNELNARRSDLEAQIVLSLSQVSDLDNKMSMVEMDLEQLKLDREKWTSDPNNYRLSHMSDNFKSDNFKWVYHAVPWNRRGEERQKIEERDQMVFERSRIASEGLRLVAEYRAIGDTFKTKNAEVETVYLEHVQQRSNYAQELGKHLRKMLIRGMLKNN